MWYPYFQFGKCAFSKQRADIREQEQILSYGQRQQLHCKTSSQVAAYDKDRRGDLTESKQRWLYLYQELITAHRNALGKLHWVGVLNREVFFLSVSFCLLISVGFFNTTGQDRQEPSLLERVSLLSTVLKDTAGFLFVVCLILLLLIIYEFYMMHSDPTYFPVSSNAPSALATPPKKTKVKRKNKETKQNKKNKRRLLLQKL